MTMPGPNCTVVDDGSGDLDAAWRAARTLASHWQVLGYLKKCVIVFCRWNADMTSNNLRAKSLQLAFVAVG